MSFTAFTPTFHIHHNSIRDTPMSDVCMVYSRVLLADPRVLQHTTPHSEMPKIILTSHHIDAAGFNLLISFISSTTQSEVLVDKHSLPMIISAPNFARAGM